MFFGSDWRSSLKHSFLKALFEAPLAPDIVESSSASRTAAPPPIGFGTQSKLPRQQFPRR